MNKFKSYFSWLWSLVVAFFIASSTLINASVAFDQFPYGRYEFAGMTNGADRKRRTNRLRVSRVARRKNRR